MMKGEASKSKKKKAVGDLFTDTLFSWSLEDVFNEDHFKNKVFLLFTLSAYTFSYFSNY